MTLFRRCVDSLNPALRKLGFVRSGSLWNRNAGVFVDVVDVQMSRYDEVATVNLGVFHREVYETCWGPFEDQSVEATSSIVRTRLGILLDGKDKWWDIRDVVEVDQMTHAVLNAGMPFLANMHSLERMCQFLRADRRRSQYPPESVYLAIMLVMLGNVAEGCEMFRSLERSLSNEWRGRVHRIAQAKCRN
jgi:hypothetical protein